MTVSRTICLGFLGVIAIGTILLMMPFSLSSGTWNDPITALFTATSATCVTGLIVVDTGSYYSFWGQFFILSMIQVGGLGYMTATTFLLILLGRRFKLKYKVALQQALDTAGLSNVGQLLRSIIATTLLVELTGVFLLMLVFARDLGFKVGVWQSIFHSISAFNNAGFSLFADSLMGYATSPVINLVIPALVIFGGIGYQVILEAYLWLRGKISRSAERFCFSLHFKIVTSTNNFLLVLGTLIYFFAEYHNPLTLASFNFQGQLMAAWFQSVITRTAGFNSIDLGQMTNAALFAMMILMLIGASPGSTGGGLKTTTVRVLFNCTQAVLQGREDVNIGRRQIPVELILKAVSVVVGSLLTIAIATALISITDPGLEFISVSFEVISAFATVGLSIGITSKLSILGKLAIVLIMYIGRVGILLLMSAILGDPTPSAVDYPEEELLVG
ncbi:MAG: TrkH family potassium uptake protein [Cyanobacteriota bacterium]|nr:TrkH family potassium uptake protein [Cyanobacteriota bacterium]